MSHLAPALTEDEAKFLHDQQRSEHFRIFSKAIAYLYSLKCAELATIDQAQFARYQGILQGMMMARNLMALQKVPDPKTLR